MSRRCIVFLTCISIVTAGGAVAAGNEPQPQAQRWEQCQSPTSSPWLRDLYQRILQHDGLFHYVRRAYGLPASCAGSVTMEFDGQQFGEIALRWSNGIEFAIATYPPESSRLEVSFSDVVVDSSDLLPALRQYVQQLGLSVDWSAPKRQPLVAGTSEIYEAQPVGMNAAIGVEYSPQGNVRLVTVSLAL